MKPARRAHENTGTGHAAGMQKDDWAEGLISAFVGLPAAKVKNQSPIDRQTVQFHCVRGMVKCDANRY
ncbi:hypothetical protein [Komagataeibacter xylinus]|uniref:hypothetical protein n=1 Tax=Komagataeibacter xylinus TaxID=28448 RepID=UPI000A7576A6|nr:hypothetical protein [Komagataeibacter xylinus]GBQ77661.1 hypothetical protein AA15237_2615 [Komagataeibacter xylinus NBRC 15237]